jgi:hypothetical protein
MVVFSKYSNIVSRIRENESGDLGGDWRPSFASEVGVGCEAGAVDVGEDGRDAEAPVESMSGTLGSTAAAEAVAGPRPDLFARLRCLLYSSYPT